MPLHKDPEQPERIRLLRSIDRRLALLSMDEEIAADPTNDQQVEAIKAAIRELEGTLRILVRSRLAHPAPQGEVE